MTNPKYTHADYLRDCKIRDGAPEGCFAVDHLIGSKKPVYICLREEGFVAIHDGTVIGTTTNQYPFSVRFRSLSDIKRLIAMYEREQWIPVSERLPETYAAVTCVVHTPEGDKYLSTAEYFPESEPSYNDLHGFLESTQDTDYSILKHVVAWRLNVLPS